MISGNIPPVDIMRDGSVDDVINFTKECISKDSDSPNGYYVDVGCQLPLNVPIENVYAFIYAIRKYGSSAIIGEIPKGFTS